MFQNLFKNFIKKFTISQFIKDLVQPSQGYRARAFRSLVREGDNGINYLVPYLADKDRREIISEILQKIGTSEAVRALINAVSPEDIYWNRILQKRLSEIGKNAILPLLHSLYTGDRNKQILSAETLGLIDDKRSVQGLLKALNIADDRVKVSIIDSLGQLKDEEAVSPLLDLLSGNSNEIQKNSIKLALSEIGITAVYNLLEALRGTDMTFKRSLIEILGNINDRRVIPPLIEYLRSPHETISGAAVNALGKKPESLTMIIEGLEDQNPSYRKNCASVLGKIISVGNIDSLLKACRDEDESVARNAIIALGEIGNDMARDNLMELLKSNNYYHAKTVIEALAKMSDKAVPPLITSLSDRDSSVRERAATSLIKIGQRSVIPLIEAAKKGKEPLREVVKGILKEIGPCVISDMIKVLSEGDEELVKFASDVLVSYKESSLWYLQKSFLDTPHWPVKKRSAKVLSMIGIKSLDILIKGLSNREKALRELSSQAISDIGPSVIPFLIEGLEKKMDFPEYISKTFSHLGQSVICELLTYIDNDNDMIRRYTVDGIIRMELSAIKPLCNLMDIENSVSKKQKIMMILIDLLRNYKPKDKKLSTSDIDSLRLGIEMLRKYREKCGSGVITTFGVKWGRSAEKLLMEVMDVSPKDIVIFIDDDEPGKAIEITDI